MMSLNISLSHRSSPIEVKELIHSYFLKHHFSISGVMGLIVYNFDDCYICILPVLQVGHKSI